MLSEGFVYKTKSGKTKSVFDEMAIWLGTMDAIETFKALPCKNIVVLNDYDDVQFEEYLNDLQKHQMERLEKGKPPLNILLAYDDYCGEGLTKRRNGKSSTLERLMLKSRHEYNATVMFCAQHYKNNGICVPAVRNNVNYWIMYQLARNDVEKVAEEHSGKYTPDQFIHMYEETQKKPHQFMMISYKKPMNERFTFGFTTPLTPETVL